MVLHSSVQLFDAFIISPLDNGDKFIPANSENGTALKNAADNTAGIPQVFVPRFMSGCIIDLLQIIHVKNGNGEGRYAVLCNLIVQPFLCFQVSMPVFDAGQRVKVGFLLGPLEASFVFFLLPDLCVDIDDTDDQARTFLFFDNGCPKLYITRRPEAVHNAASLSA